MIDDMTARRFKEKVQKDYVRHVRSFAAFLGRSPGTATSEDLRRFQLHMAQQQISPAFQRRPRIARDHPGRGRRPKPFTQAKVPDCECPMLSGKTELAI
jgi:hypothetical protein